MIDGRLKIWQSRNNVFYFEAKFKKLLKKNFLFFEFFNFGMKQFINIFF